MPPPPPPAPRGPPAPRPMVPKGGGDDRGALLSSIRTGTKLKKTVTNDRSGPVVDVQVSGWLAGWEEGLVTG
ncbi:hypothetical protein Pmani_035083 [Petrolisthes manimaculis]|uniref:WH2 domain-containing protein n=1 Tax=Petrolisthes manimaculis TaxID=1843537 RepID=A0AAE1NN36_9EUCA|nr:hypothetical protein Pmani_035083 [Petrolisthes manimaculis]